MSEFKTWIKSNILALTYGHYIDTDIAKKISGVEESKAKTVKHPTLFIGK